MIDYVKGTLAEKSLAAVTVDAAGVGYFVEIPLSTYEALPKVGEPLKLFTHHHVREDSQKLFGFATKEERELFRQLIGISQIGPKVALSVLSKVTVRELARAVATGDPSRLKSVPGVGAKTAERLVMELKGKLKGIEGVPGTGAGAAGPGAGPQAGGPQREAYEALLSLGYSDKQVARALDRVAETVDSDTAGVEEWIKKALQTI
jgi:Holliday junction DNA helicase RuvA